MPTIAEITEKAKSDLTTFYSTGQITKNFMIEQREKYYQMFNHWSAINKEISKEIDWVENFSPNATPEDVQRLKEQSYEGSAELIHCLLLIKHINTLMEK